MEKSIKSYFVYGKHPSMSVLQNINRKIIRIFCIEEIFNNLAFKPHVLKHKFQIVNRSALDKMLGTNSIHQGIAIETMPITSKNLKLLDLSKKQTLIILDQITDQQNFGSILRSATTFGVNTIIVPSKNCAKENASLAKAASGALEFVNIIEVVNINQTIEILKKNYFWIVGLDHEAQNYIHQYTAPDKIAVVLGSEDQGIRKLTKEKCDTLLKIPIIQNQMIDSLNVGVATGICLYELFKNTLK